MGKELHRVYLNNEPWIYDDDNKVFWKVGDASLGVPFELVEREGRHIASLLIVAIKGYPYYQDERLREFRRVGEPSFVLTYEQFNLLPEKDRRLTVPTGDAFRQVMKKEAAYWKRRRQQDADADGGRGR